MLVVTAAFRELETCTQPEDECGAINQNATTFNISRSSDMDELNCAMCGYLRIRLEFEIEYI